MIILEPTPKNAGVTLYGDYNDLHALYETIHKIVSESQCAEHMGDFILGLAYEVRKAFEMQREEKAFGIDPMDQVTYRGTQLLWPYFLLQVRLLRNLCAYCPTHKADQAQLYHLESQIEKLLIEIDSNIGMVCLEWFNTPTLVDERFYFLFVEEKTLSYIMGPQGKARFKKLPEILWSLHPGSEDYQSFSADLEAQAKKLGGTPYSLQSNREWPDFQW